MATTRTPVLIAGAGPTGLALAIELGVRGIACLVVERNDRVGYAPRAKTTHTRTREHLRRWGIAEKLAAASPFGVDYPSDIHFVTRLAGRPLAKIENAFNAAPGLNEAYSEHAQWIPQYKLEEVLRAHAATLPGVDIRFSCDLEHADQSADVVTSRVKDLASGETFMVESDFLVGADGARSLVRELIGAKLEGTYGLSRHLNIIFRAPGLAEAHGHGPGIMYWQLNADIPSVIGPMDSDDRWFFSPASPGAALDDDQTRHMIRQATGIDLPFEILSRDEWVASELIADTYRKGRIFLAGDACHLHPPFGGYGMNMGMADAIDLGWKFAAVLKDWGGEALLHSYELERREVHRQVIDEAVANHAVLPAHLFKAGLDDDGDAGDAAREAVRQAIMDTKVREFKSLGIVLGYCYASSPVIAYDGERPTASEWRAYEPSPTPGRLAPHLWLADGRSLYDLFGEGFTLIATPRAREADIERARIDLDAVGAPLDVLRLDDTRLSELYAAPLILVRPDQHVAWRGQTWPGPGLVRTVTGRASSQVADARKVTAR